MNGPARITALAVALAGMVLSMSGCDRLAARDQLNKGVEAYKGAHYEEAIGHFQKATQLDPSLPMAKSYLATALAQNVVPGLDTPDNLKTAQQAIDIFQEVLAKDPHDVNSMKQIAGIYFSIKKLDDAKAWQKKVLAEDPKDPEAAYTVGVIDWTQAHENALTALAAGGHQRRRRRQRQGAQEGDGAAEGAECPAGRGRLAVSEPGSGEPAQLRRCHGLPEPDLPPQGRCGLRQRGRASRTTWPRPRSGAPRRWAPARPTKRRKPGPGGITMGDNGEMK